MTIRTLLAVVPLFAALTAVGCASAPPPVTEPRATVECPDGLGSCGEFGPPVLRYCEQWGGACDGHVLPREQIGGHLFAGRTATGHGTTS